MQVQPDNAPLTDQQRSFMRFCAYKNALKFDLESGFVLNSGRVSPWFFQEGDLMSDGEGLQQLAKIYVDTLLRGFETADHTISADVLYGPAYKGIPIAVAVTTELYRQRGLNLGFASHRKEKKDHGADVGRGFCQNVQGKRCILIDDVITAGKATRSSQGDIEADGGTVQGMVVLLDRQEVSPPEEGDATLPLASGVPRISAVTALEQTLGIKIISALTYVHIRQAIDEGLIGNADIGEAMDVYQNIYGVNSD